MGTSCGQSEGFVALRCEVCKIHPGETTISTRPRLEKTAQNFPFRQSPAEESLAMQPPRLWRTLRTGTGILWPGGSPRKPDPAQQAHFLGLATRPMTYPGSMDYPEKTCTLDRLVRHPRLVAKVLNGEKTQQRRNGVYGYPGETFVLEEETFEITDLRRESLDEMGATEVKAEGYPNMEAYKQLIIRMHKGMAWNGSAMVWVHEFRRA